MTWEGLRYGVVVVVCGLVVAAVGVNVIVSSASIGVFSAAAWLFGLPMRMVRRNG